MAHLHARIGRCPTGIHCLICLYPTGRWVFSNDQPPNLRGLRGHKREVTSTLAWRFPCYHTRATPVPIDLSILIVTSWELPSGNDSHSYWNLSFIVRFPSKKWWFSIVMLVYQRVPWNMLANLLIVIVLFLVIIIITMRSTPRTIQPWKHPFRTQVCLHGLYFLERLGPVATLVNRSVEYI